MTTTEAKELIQRSRSASAENESTPVEQLVRFLEDQIVQSFCLKKVFGPDEIPPKTFAEFFANLHEVDSGRRLVEIVTEELASRLPRYGTRLTKKRAIMAIEPVYVAVRDEWLNRYVLGCDNNEERARELEVKMKTCPDCGCGYGQRHRDDCDVERCSSCCQQRATCGCEDHDPDEAVWMGVWPAGKQVGP